MKTQMDPGYVREFARFLSGISEEIQRLNSSMASDWQSVSMNGWDDQLARRFGQILEEGQNGLSTFAERSQRYCEMLERKAEHIERYLDR
jgi:predicted DNA-binding WGR domain protein